jgi:fumarate reductase flavoprotein subunit
MSAKHEADVVIIGGGASGITAAVAAAQKEASVIVVEKGSTTGGAANMGMAFFAVESSMQREQMIDMTKEGAFKFFMEYTHWRAPARLVRRYFEQSASTVDWVKDMGVKFLGVYKYFKESFQTQHMVKAPGSDSPAERSASNLYKALTDEAERLGVEILYHTKAEKIVMNDGKVCGVNIVKEDGSKETIECDAVIVSTGGFGDNPDMLKSELGYTWGKDLHSFRIPGNVGEGLKMLWEAGAMKTQPVMEHTYTTPGVTDVYKTLSETMRQPNLMVNLEGKRFINEEIMNNTTFTGNAITQQTKRMGFSIITDDILNTYRKTGLPYITFHHNIKTVDKWEKELDAYTSGKGIEASGLSMLHSDEQKQEKEFYVCDTIEEICEKTGINLENLKNTIKEYNDACHSEDSLFFKSHKYMLPIEKGKYYVARHFPAGYGSLGGVLTDENMQALTPEHQPIPGLFSCGTDACSIFGDSYCFLMPGNTMGFAINSGRIAGTEAINYIDTLD